MELFGQSISKEDLLRRVGDISQIAAVTPVTLKDGVSAGVDAVTFRTGSGFSFVALPGRGLDISWAEYQGLPLCWRSPTGEVAAAFYEPNGKGWLRSFYGGLFVTCGLSAAGQPSTDDGEQFGLHGRVANLPASRVQADAVWEGETYRMWVQGKVRETSALGNTLELSRKIETWLGESRLAVTDVVENLGSKPTAHMYRYHINAGFPILSADSQLVAPVESVSPRDEASAAGLADWNRFSHPETDYTEQVFYLDFAPDEDGTATVALINPDRGGGHPFGLYVKYLYEPLQRFVLWKMLGAGDYAVGLEPSNCYDEGRAAERARGSLVELAPGEQRSYHMEIGVLDSEESIESMLRRGHESPRLESSNDHPRPERRRNGV